MDLTIHFKDENELKFEIQKLVKLLNLDSTQMGLPFVESQKVSTTAAAPIIPKLQISQSESAAVVDNPLPTNNFMSDVKSFAETHGMNGISKALAQFKVKKVKDLIPAQYAEFLECLNQSIS